MEKALVIGAAGFVGGYLIDCLSKEFGMKVFGTRLSNQSFSHKNAEIFDLDIMDKTQISNLLLKIHPDKIFHLAAQSSVALSWKNPQLTVDINVKGAVNILEAVKDLDYKPKLLMIGSSEEYGRAAVGNVDENNSLKPGNVYAATKACQNMLGAIYAKAYGLDIISVRAFNHIGPGQAEGFVMSDFCKQVAEIEAGKREPVMSVGNLSASRDFTDVRDVVRAYALLAQKGTAGETYNVGSGRAVQIQSLLDRIVARSKVAIEVRIDQAKLRPVDVPKIEADISKITQETGWKPELDINDTIGDVLDWWRKRV